MERLNGCKYRPVNMKTNKVSSISQLINQSNYHSNDGGEKIQSLRHPVSRGGAGLFSRSVLTPSGVELSEDASRCLAEMEKLGVTEARSKNCLLAAPTVMGR